MQLLWIMQYFAVVCGSGNCNGPTQSGKDGKTETQVRETKFRPHGDRQQPHFGKAHRRNQVHEINEYFDSATEYADSDGEFFVGTVNTRNDEYVIKWMEEMQLDGHCIQAKLDTGAQANVLPLRIYEKLKLRISLQKTKTTLNAFGNNKLKPVGAITVPMESNGIREKSEILHDRRSRYSYIRSVSV